MLSVRQPTFPWAHIHKHTDRRNAIPVSLQTLLVITLSLESGMAPERTSRNSYLFLIILLTWLTYHPLPNSAADAVAIWEEVPRGRFSRIQSTIDSEGNGLAMFLGSVLAEELSECSLGVIWSEEEEGKTEAEMQEVKEKERGISEEGKKEEEVREERDGREIREHTHERKKEEKENVLTEEDEMGEKIKHENLERNVKNSREEKEEKNGGYDWPLFNWILASSNSRQVS